MEVQLMRREIIFDGKKYEPEYLATYELIDGGPSKHERLPFRLFLKSYNITPSYPNIEEIFGVKYFINFVIVDDDDNRYFKYAEINLFRLFSDRRTHLANYDNNGLFITKPFFEDEYSYGNDSSNNFVNQISEDNYDKYDNSEENNNFRNANDFYYNKNYNKFKSNRSNNSDNNMVLNIPGEDFDNYNLNDRNDENDFNGYNNNISRRNPILDRRNNIQDNYDRLRIILIILKKIKHLMILGWKIIIIKLIIFMIMMITLKILKMNFIKIIIET